MLTNWQTDAVSSGGDNYGQLAESLEEFTTRAEESTVANFTLLTLGIKSVFIFTRFSYALHHGATKFTVIPFTLGWWGNILCYMKTQRWIGIRLCNMIVS